MKKILLVGNYGSRRKLVAYLLAVDRRESDFEALPPAA